jgi:hypothetical protein
MKTKVTWLLTAILICLTATLVSSCKDKEMQDVFGAANIVGTWNSSKTRPTTTLSTSYQTNVKGIITFEASGSFHEDNGKSGRWTFKDNELTLYYPNGEGRSMRYAMQDGYNRDQMTLTATFKADDGFTYTSSLILYR